jgi:hypothetical protein
MNGLKQGVMITRCKEDAQKMLSSFYQVPHKKWAWLTNAKLFCSVMVNLLHLLPIEVILGVHVLIHGVAIRTPSGTDLGLRKAVFLANFLMYV